MYACAPAQSIIFDRREVLPVSVLHPVLGTCIGWPSVIGREGVARLMPLQLTDEEYCSISESARIVGAISDWTLTKASWWWLKSTLLFFFAHPATSLIYVAFVTSREGGACASHAVRYRRASAKLSDIARS